jgi:hypothetical protein
MRRIGGLFLLLVGSTAHGEPESFPILERQDEASKVGVLIGAQRYSTEGSPDVGVRIEAYGRIAFADGWGIFGAWPLLSVTAGGPISCSYSNGSPTPTDCTPLVAGRATGNLELGVFHVSHTGKSTVTLSASVVVPLAPEFDEANQFTLGQRIVDAPLGLSSPWLRLATTLRPAAFDAVFWQLDAGVDIATLGAVMPRLGFGVGHRSSGSRWSAMGQIVLAMPLVTSGESGVADIYVELSPALRYALSPAVAVSLSYAMTYLARSGDMHHSLLLGLEVAPR